jgi:hypothetical protein
MDDDMKWYLALIASFVIIPMLGLGVSEWRKQDCRIELAKAGKTVDEIKEICK